MIPRTRREHGNSPQRDPGSSKPGSFAMVLDRAMDESQPVDCYTVTYNASSKLQAFSYQPSREYTF